LVKYYKKKQRHQLFFLNYPMTT